MTYGDTGLGQIDSGHGLLNTKPFDEQMLPLYHVFLGFNLGQFYKKCSWPAYYFRDMVRK